MRYREHAPSPALAPWLACVWQRAGDGAAPVRVLPDGCIDIVWSESGGTELIGANSTAFLAAADGRVIGARFRPGGAPAILGIDAERVLDQRLPLHDVLGDAGRWLGAAMSGAGDPVGELTEWLARRAAGAPAPDPVVTGSVARLDGGGRLSSLAGELGLSERTLRRRMTAAVGYGPKRLDRVLRLWRALRTAREGEDLAGAAFRAGYADQAHFSHDCRDLAGVPPSSLI